MTTHLLKDLNQDVDFSSDNDHFSWPWVSCSCPDVLCWVYNIVLIFTNSMARKSCESDFRWVKYGPKIKPRSVACAHACTPTPASLGGLAYYCLLLAMPPRGGGRGRENKRKSKSEKELKGERVWGLKWEIITSFIFLIYSNTSTHFPTLSSNCPPHVSLNTSSFH